MFKYTQIQNRAFSLVELMVVLSIISIVVGLAFPKYQTFKLRAGIMEAPTNLRFISTLQESYNSENGEYGLLNWYGDLNGSCRQPTRGSATNQIGFSNSTGCNSKYAYYTRSNRDYFNSTWTAAQSDNHYSALADSIDWSTLTRGSSLGVSRQYCINQSIRDMVVINQDGDLGTYREGELGYKHRAYSAMVACQ